MFTAAQWRDTIKRASDAYTETPGGAPPAELIEAMVDVSSGGDPESKRGDGSGLAAVTPAAALAWQKIYGREPNLWSPEDNIAVATYTLDTLQAQGGALGDWYGAALAEGTGAVTTDGVTSSPEAIDYFLNIRTYIATTFGDAKNLEIDTRQQGAFNLQDGELIYDGSWLDATEGGWHPVDQAADAAKDAAKGVVSGAVGAVTGAVGDQIAKVTGFLASWLPRVGFFFIGAMVLLFGAWFLFKGGGGGPLKGKGAK